MNMLAEKLKAAKSAGTAPAGLHNSIMNAVRTAAQAQAQAPGAHLAPPRWLLAAGVVGVILIGAWAMGLMIVSRRGPAQSLASAEPAWAAGHELAREVPAAMLAPMTDELAAVNRDFQRAVDHLLASVP